jgi:glutaredoxin-like YruB-family protein
MKKVEIYSTPACQYCDMAKSFFTNNDVQYVEYDVAADVERRKEMVEKSGQIGVPVTVINEEVIVGFDEAAFKEKLGL